MGSPRWVSALVALAVALTPVTGVVGSRARASAARVPAGIEARAAPALNRQVFGFFTPGAQQYMLEEADYSVLSTVAFFALDALPDGRLDTVRNGTPTPGWAAWNSAWMSQVIEKAHDAGGRVVLTIKRFAWTNAEWSETVELLGSASARTRLVQETADAVVARGVDGVNLDFEPLPRDVRFEFVSLVRDLRQELDLRQPGLSLTFDATGYMTNYPITELTADGAADAVFIMGYPYKGRWSERAGAVSPLSGLKYDLTDTVDEYLEHTSADKIILGLPYYGFEWSTETKYLHSRVRPKGPTYGYPRAVPMTSAIDVAAIRGRRWDREQFVPWTRWRWRACASCPRTWRQLYYEDVQSLGLKYDLANSRDLAGVGFWKLGSDAGRPELYDLLRDKFGGS